MQETLATYVHDAGGSVGARSGKNSAILDVLHSASELVASRDFAARVQTSGELARALAPLLLPPKLTAANCPPSVLWGMLVRS